MTIPKRELPDGLMCLMLQVKEGTTILELISVFIITVLTRHNGSRTKTSKELKIPIRSLRNKIGEIESLGYAVPEPISTNCGYASYKMRKETKETKETKGKRRKKKRKKIKTYEL